MTAVPEQDDRELASLLDRVRRRDSAAEDAFCRRFWPFVRRRVQEARRRRNWFWLGDVEGVVHEHGEHGECTQAVELYPPSFDRHFATRQD